MNKEYLKHQLATLPWLKRHIDRCNKIRATIKGKCNKSKLPEWIGCSFEFFKAYCEAYMFLGDEGMTWEELVSGKNAGTTGIHIDHIREKIEFCRNGDLEEMKKAHHWSNLRPMRAQDNIRRKRTKAQTPNQLTLL